MPHTSRRPFSIELEARNTQRFFTVGGAAILALLAPFRVLITVHFLNPTEYGFLSIVSTITSFVPYLMTLGYPWQYQLMTAELGPAALETLSRHARSIILRTAVPCGAITALFVAPFASWDRTIPIVVLAVITSACVAYMILASQALLGLEKRSSAALCLLLYNSLCTLLLIPLGTFGTVSILSLVSLWTAAAILGALVSRILLKRFRQIESMTRLPLSFTQAVWSLPVQLGPWTFLMLGRYFLGLSTSTAEVTNFSLAWTVADLSFLVSVSGVTYLSTRLMRREISPKRVFFISACSYAILLSCFATVASVAIPVMNPQYRVSMTLVSILALAGLARLAQATWTPIVVSRSAIHRLSIIYLVLTVAFIPVLVTSRVTSLDLSLMLALTLGTAAFASSSRIAMKGSRP